VHQFSNQLANTDLVIGAKGSPLQLILSTVFQLDHPTGNIPLNEVEQWEKHPMVKSSLPLSLGDYFKGFPIAGTIPNYLIFHQLQLASGRNFSNPFEAVLGSEAASATKLKVGDQFYSAHGQAAPNTKE
jgi:putative ABC transport system permease protein